MGMIGAAQNLIIGVGRVQRICRSGVKAAAPKESVLTLLNRSRSRMKRILFSLDLRWTMDVS